jgi:transcriptional regulator with XRE-family HTH domain
VRKYISKSSKKTTKGAGRLVVEQKSALRSGAAKKTSAGRKSDPEPQADSSQLIHGARPSASQTLEASIGNQIRTLRKMKNLTVSEMAKESGLSISMLSKIENGATSPSLSTLQALAAALSVPITTFFAKFDQKRDSSFVRDGEGLLIERRGTKSGHQYRLLGHSVSGDVGVEPYLITLTNEADPFPVFEHEGVEFIYMLEGEVDYRHADKSYTLRKGDSLFFDATAPHGPETLRVLPMHYLSIIIYPRE